MPWRNSTEMQTLQSLVCSLRLWRQRPAIGLRAEYGLRWWSYEQLHRNALQAADILRKHTLQPQSKIIIWSANCPEWLAFFFGAALRGLIVVPADADWPVSRVAEFAAKFDASLLVCSPDKDTSSIPITRQNLFSFDAETRNIIWDNVCVPIQKDDPAVILWTSGTSSEPRGVVLTHANLMVQASHFWYWKCVTRLIPIRLLALSPLTHIQGLMVGGVVPLSLGLSVIQSQSVAPQHLLRTMQAGRVTVLSTVPKILEVLEESLVKNTGSRLLPRMVRVRRSLGGRFLVLLVGGATLPKARERFWRASGCFLVQGYGSTETAAFATINRPFVGAFGSIGKAVHDGTIRISGDGEILVRGHHLAAGYYGGEIQPLQLTEDGYFPTGDLAMKDKRDRFYFLGRKADLIVTGEGYNVHPHTVETEIRNAPGVRDCLVFGLERNGFEEVHAVLLMTEKELAADAVRQANEALLPFQRVRGWSIWPESDFPRLTLGKVDRAKVIAEIARKDSMSSAEKIEEGKSVSLEEIQREPDRRLRAKKLIRYIMAGNQEKIPGEAVELGRDLGFQSLDMIEIFSRLEAESNTMLHYPKLAEYTTVADLQTAVRMSEMQLLPVTKDPTGWYRALVWNPLRRISRFTILDPYICSRLRISVQNKDHLTSVTPPLIFTVQLRVRRHFMDYLAIYRSIPSRLSKKLFFPTSFTGSEWRRSRDGQSRINPALVTSPFFPYAPLPRFGHVRSGLLQCCEWIDRGYSPILSWLPGAARMAVQTQVPVIPVHLEPSFSDVRTQRRPLMIVRFGKPITLSPDFNPYLAHLLVEAKLQELQNNCDRERAG